MDLAYRLAMQHPWAITEHALEALMEMARQSASSGFASLKAAWDEEFGGAEKEPKQSGGIGVIQIRGTLKQHSASSFFDFLFGGASYDGISAQLKTFLADDSVRAIVFDIDSPGGSTYGMSELANEIMDARGKKPIVAVANSLAASAAYGIGASADKFYVTPGGMVGSVGVFMVHEDVSKMAEDMGVSVSLISAGKHKTRGNQFEPLSEEDVAHFQAIIDDTYDQFAKDIARGRGVTPAAVKSGYGEGDVVTATTAKKLGMVDGVMTLAAAIEKAQTLRSKAPLGRATSDDQAAEEPPIDIQASEDEEGRKRLALIRWRALEERAAVSANQGG